MNIIVRVVRRLIASLIFCLIFSSLAIAQSPSPVPKDFGKLVSVNPNAPTTAGIMKFGEYPVEGPNGIPQISIPIHEFSSGLLSQDISLSYHAGGIKVKDRAGWVGLGWTLNVGGAITTQVNDLPDLYGYFYNVLPSIPYPITGIQDSLSHMLTSTSHARVAQGITAAGGALLSDYMPDYYFINAVGLSSGNFSFNSSWNPELFEAASTLKVEVIARDTTIVSAGGAIQVPYRKWIYGFVVTDEKGSKYYFSGKESPENLSVEATSSWPELVEAGAPFHGRDTYPFISAWYLSKIVSATKKDSIVFEYETDVTIIDEAVSHSIYAATTCDNEQTIRNYQNIETQTTKLKTIIFKNGKIVFNRSVYADGEDSRLDNITIYSSDRNNFNQKKKIEFQYGFYQNSDNTQTLKLNGITVAGNDNSIVQKYSFEYNQTALPGRESADQDHWGYFNNKSNPGKANRSTAFCALCPQQTIVLPSGQSWLLGSADRSVNDVSTQAGILTSIVYPTGGKTSFEYENHKKTNNTIVGGLRIKRIKSYKDQSSTIPVSIKRFEYEGAYSLGYADVNNNNYFKMYFRDCGECVANTNQIGVVQLVLFTNADAVYQNQSVLAYTQISEYLDDPITSTPLYKTVSQYKKVTDIARSAAYFNVPFSNSSVMLTSPYQNLSPMRVLLKKSYYSSDGKLVKQNETVYGASTQQTLISSGFLMNTNNSYSTLFNIPSYSPCGTNQFEVSNRPVQYNYAMLNYGVYQYRVLPVKIIDRDYSQSDSLVNVKQLTYSTNTTSTDVMNASWHPFPTRIDETGSDGIQQSLIIRYPWDFSISSTSDPIYNQVINLKNTHRTSEVISTLRLKNNMLLEGTVMEYNGDFPKTAHHLETDQALACSSCTATGSLSSVIPSDQTSNFKARVDYSYDLASGKLSHQQNVNDESTQYLWGYDDELLVARVSNATSYEVGFKGYEYEEDYGIVNEDAHTGRYSAKISQNESTGSFQKYNLNVRSYVYSAWVRASGNGYMKMNDMYHPSNSIQMRLPDTNGKWQYVQIVINAASGANLSTVIYNDTGGSIFVDDVRFFPLGERMVTYTYDVQAKSISSSTDENNRVTFFDYDNFARVKTIRDQKKNIIKKVDYFYKNQ